MVLQALWRDGEAMNEQIPSKDQVCEHDFACIECGASLDDLQQPLGWMTEGGQMFIEHRLKLERPEDFVRFTIPVPRVPVAANEEGASSHEPCDDLKEATRLLHVVNAWFWRASDDPDSARVDPLYPARGTSCSRAPLFAAIRALLDRYPYGGATSTKGEG